MFNDLVSAHVSVSVRVITDANRRRSKQYLAKIARPEIIQMINIKLVLMSHRKIISK